MIQKSKKIIKTKTTDQKYNTRVSQTARRTVTNVHRRVHLYCTQVRTYTTSALAHVQAHKLNSKYNNNKFITNGNKRNTQTIRKQKYKQNTCTETNKHTQRARARACMHACVRACVYMCTRSGPGVGKYSVLRSPRGFVTTCHSGKYPYSIPALVRAGVCCLFLLQSKVTINRE